MATTREMWVEEGVHFIIRCQRGKKNHLILFKNGNSRWNNVIYYAKQFTSWPDYARTNDVIDFSPSGFQ